MGVVWMSLRAMRNDRLSAPGIYRRRDRIKVLQSVHAPRVAAEVVKLETGRDRANHEFVRVAMRFDGARRLPVSLEVAVAVGVQAAGPFPAVTVLDNKPPEPDRGVDAPHAAIP